VRDLEDTRRLVSDAGETMGGIDILVNNAGRFAGGSLAELSDDTWRTEVDIKLLGAIRTTREALPRLRQGGGVVVNVAGGSAHAASVSGSISGVINSGVINFTASAARELGPQGVRVCAVAPGLTLTDSWRARAQARAEREGETIDQALAPGARGDPRCGGGRARPLGGAGRDRGARGLPGVRAGRGDQRHDRAGTRRAVRRGRVIRTGCGAAHFL
jgi:3-oxoacyl-[acyl-carrier protein] reductase